MTAVPQVGTVFRFERLDIWKRSIEFSDAVYNLTKSFPAREQFGLTSQLRRSSSSISANIAEGSSRVSNRDFSRFIEIAFGSLCETISHFHLARLQGLVNKDDFDKIYCAAAELSRMISSFRNSLGKWKTDVVDGA